MTVIRESRELLTQALEDENSTLLVLSGVENADSLAIHELLESRGDMEDWREWFLVEKLSTLTPTQRRDWFGGSVNGKYVVLGGGAPKLLGPSGFVGELLRKDGRPSILRIRRAFAQGDQL